MSYKTSERKNGGVFVSDPKKQMQAKQQQDALSMRSMFEELRRMRSSESSGNCKVEKKPATDGTLDTKKTGFSEGSDQTRQERVQTNELKKTLSEDGIFFCSYCQETTLVEDEGIWVCTACGRDNGPVITSAQEWRNFSDSSSSRNADPSRCGMPVNPLLPQSSLGTVVQGYGSQRYRKLQMQNAMPSAEKTLYEAIKLMRGVGMTLNVPATIIDKACYLYSELTKGIKVKRGDVRRGLMAYCIYVFCKDKRYGCYVCPEKLAKAFGIALKSYHEGAKLFGDLSYQKTRNKEKTVSWSRKFSNARQSFVSPTSPENYILRAGKSLQFTPDQITEITYVARVAKKLGMVGEKMPQSIAAGCLILYIKERKIKKIPTKKISELCRVSDITAKGTYNELRKGRKYLFPQKGVDVSTGVVGDCRPPKRLETIYTAPRSAIPPAQRISMKPKRV